MFLGCDAACGHPSCVAMPPHQPAVSSVDPNPELGMVSVPHGDDEEASEFRYHEMFCPSFCRCLGYSLRRFVAGDLLRDPRSKCMTRSGRKGEVVDHCAWHLDRGNASCPGRVFLRGLILSFNRDDWRRSVYPLTLQSNECMYRCSQPELLCGWIYRCCDRLQCFQLTMRDEIPNGAVMLIPAVMPAFLQGGVDV